MNQLKLHKHAPTHVYNIDINVYYLVVYNIIKTEPN